MTHKCNHFISFYVFLNSKLGIQANNEFVNATLFMEIKTTHQK